MERGTAGRGNLPLAVGEGVGRERVRAVIVVTDGVVIGGTTGMVTCAAVRVVGRGRNRVVGVLTSGWTGLVLAVRAVRGGGVLAAML